MNQLITKLSNALANELKSADEIWIAVALLNLDGLNLILENLKQGCKQNYLIGVDLPSDPKALTKLYELKLKQDLQVQLYTDQQYFHPKLYLLKKRNLFKGFVGSANCTRGGLNTNVELTIAIDDQKACSQMLEWFEQLNKSGKPLTTKFITKYQADYIERQKKKKEDERLVKREKKELNNEIKVTFSERNEFLKVLKSYRRAKEYTEVKEIRKNSVNQLRLSLDYPNFNKIDVDWFFSIWELGHIIALPKPTIKREIKTFRKLLLMLCNEQEDVALRYNLALTGNLKIKGINEALISKILAIHRPDFYFVKNSKSDIALKKYGIELPRGLSKGDKYKITCKVLQKICVETNIDNLAILDNYLYYEGNESE